MTFANAFPLMRRNDAWTAHIDEMLDEAVRAVGTWSSMWEPRCNVFEDEQGFTVQLALPGYERDQLDIQLEHNVLRVTGERKPDSSEGRSWYRRDIDEGRFSCSFRLPAYADHDKSTASFKHGMLTITFPKREEAKPRRILIQAA